MSYASVSKRKIQIQRKYKKNINSKKIQKKNKDQRLIKCKRKKHIKEKKRKYRGPNFSSQNTNNRNKKKIYQVRKRRHYYQD